MEFLWTYRNLVAGLPLVFAVVSQRWEWDKDSVLWPIAIVLCVVGIAVRSWAACYCRYGQGEKKTLAVTGPYALVRNPLYWGNILVLAGAIVASELAWLLLVAMPWAFLVYDSAVRVEEHRLAQKYGEEFERYKLAVGRWFPRRWPRGSGAPIVPRGSLLRTAVGQFPNIFVLLPFLAKEINIFDLWPPG